MKTKWYQKSKYNKMPLIVYVGECSNCGAQHESAYKDEKIQCCLEIVTCSYAKDANEGKLDCNFGSTIDRTNNGETASYINQGLTEKEALDKYYEPYEKDENFIMPFGKYKNCHLSTIKKREPGYLKWLVKENIMLIKKELLED